jgi:hydrogenase/urease accessory protein HupE
LVEVTRSRFLFVAVMACFVTRAALGHPIPFSYLDLRLSPQGFDGTLTIHAIDLAHDLNLESPGLLLNQSFVESNRAGIVALVQSRLVMTADGETLQLEPGQIEALPDRQSVGLQMSSRWTRLPGVLEVRCGLFPYDPQHQTFLNIYEGERLAHQEIFDKDRQAFEYFTGSRQGTWAVVRKFVPAGVHHIFIGPDHILFIIGLMLMGGGLFRLLKIVTAFTVAHSITLALATLNIVNPPSQIIEPAIALSIMYVGADNLMVGKEGRDFRTWIAFFFGLLHGFGFATVLREFGLPSQAIGWSLFSFNLGVEIGQALIVLAVVPLLAMIRRRNHRLAARIVKAGSVCVILAGGYWFLQRLLFD